MEFRSFDPEKVSTKELHAVLLGGVAPRPIAFASTVDTEGRPNLSPFSFFNVFSSNPPTLIFSPARRVRDNTTKHTLENAEATREVVINIVNHKIVDQMNMASAEYGLGVNEFEKAGFTAVPSEKVKPFRVKESPMNLECRVNEIISLGKHGGAGNLIVCEVLLVHVQEQVLDQNGVIDPHKIDQVARMGGSWYTRAREGLFQLNAPKEKDNMGFDQLPEDIRSSRHFTGSELTKLARVEKLPSDEEVQQVLDSSGVKEIREHYHNDKTLFTSKLHNLAKNLLAEDKVNEAWKVLLAGRKG